MAIDNAFRVACQLASPREEHPAARHASFRRPTLSTPISEEETCLT